MKRVESRMFVGTSLYNISLLFMTRMQNAVGRIMIQHLKCKITFNFVGEIRPFLTASKFCGSVLKVFLP